MTHNGTHRPGAARPRRGEGPWVPISAAAKALGVSSSTLRLWASDGRIPHVRTAGGHRRFNPDALRQWLAERPGREAAPAPTRAEARVPVAPEVSHAIRMSADRVLVVVGDVVDGAAGVAYRRLSDGERRDAVMGWLQALAEAFETGSLAAGLARARDYGRAHGLAGSSADLTLGGSLALERAIDRALSHGPGALDPDRRRMILDALGRLTVAVAGAWAAARAEETP